MSRERGSTALEAGLFIPVLLLLLIGMAQIARVTYVYYTLQRTLYAVARQVATSQGADFCDAADAVIAAAKNFALTGTSDGSAESFLPGLQADMIEVAMERLDPATAELGASTSCESGAPDYIVVSIPNGYMIQPRIPYVLSDAIPLRPHVRVRYGGT
jgi:hypothetical protein